MNRKGQALIESVVALPVLMLSLGGLLYLVYHSVLFFYLSYQLEETLICMTSRSSSQACENELRSGVKRVLLFNEKFQVDFRNAGKLRTAKLVLNSLKPIEIQMKMAKKLEDL